ncbi:MAG: response regulator transcription factor [Vicinamibacterales bacterium]
MKLLLVEDDASISRVLLRGLKEDGHIVEHVGDGTTAEERATLEIFDAIVLDILLPGIDGFEVCRRLRASKVDTPILVISARTSPSDRVRGLDAGADDYLSKPFDFDELLARLRALARRGRTRHLTSTLKYGPLEIDTRDHLVFCRGTALELTATEFRLLEYLVRRAETVVSRSQIVEEVWGANYEGESNLADVYVYYVRRKLGPHGCGDLIRTIRGLGYMLKDRAAND